MPKPEQHEHFNREMKPFQDKEISVFQEESRLYLENLFGNDFNFLASEKMRNEISRFGEEEFEKLGSALDDLKFGDRKVSADDIIGLVRLASFLIGENQKRMAEISGNEKNSLINEVSGIISEEYGVKIENILRDSAITSEPLSPVVPEEKVPEAGQKLPDHLLSRALKKFLIDLYINGKSLNDLGGFYAYFQKKGYKDNAIHRALASVLHLVNAKTAMQFAGQGVLKNLDKMIVSNKDLSPQLGRMEIKSDETGGFQIKAEGLTPSELAHEEIKGLLEYVSLDTALPEKREITREDAQKFKMFLERQSLEILCGVFGPALSKKLDVFLGEMIDSNDERIRQELASIIDLPPREVQKNKVAFLRLYKVFTMLDTDDIIQFYKDALEGKRFSTHHLALLKEAEGNYRESL